MQFIDLKTQYQLIRDDVLAAIETVLEHGQYIMGPEVKALEEQLAAICQARYALGVSTGTDALLIALLAADVKPGDEVITTPFSFIATAESIALLGAKPVFVDIDADTYNINPENIAAAITEKTKVIMPVSLYGQCSDMDRINAIAAKHDLMVIEDAAQSFGATYKGRHSCNLSHIATTSFYPAKVLGAYGEGGGCFTSDEVLAEKMAMIRNHGQDKRYFHQMIGLNGRLDSIKCAVLLQKLKLFNNEIEQRQKVAERYDEALSQYLKTPKIEAHNTSVYAQYTIEVDERDTVRATLSERGIPTAVHYPMPLHLQPAFSHLGYKTGDMPIAERAAQRVMSLPMHPYLSEVDQDKVIQALI